MGPGGTTTSKKILPRLPLLQTPSLATGKSRQNESEDPPEAVTARDAANARHHSAAGLVEPRGGASDCKSGTVEAGNRSGAPYLETQTTVRCVREWIEESGVLLCYDDAGIYYCLMNLLR